MQTVHDGALAQLGEHLLCKQGVIGSIPIGSTMNRPQPVSSVVERLVHIEDAGGSNPSRATILSGAVAQPGERLHGMQEVRGSIPLGSTMICEAQLPDSTAVAFSRSAPAA